MAGLKHHIQQYGLQPGKGFNDIENPLERDLAFRSMTVSPYCKHCGKLILDSRQDESGSVANVEWEQKNNAHFICHKQWEAKVKAQAQAKEEEQVDWDAYIANTMRQREE